MAKRREAIRNLIKGVGILGTGGLIWSNSLNSANALRPVLRPPGAIPEDDFRKACIKCGQCVEVCPYNTLELNKNNSENIIGTPSFKPRKIPCYLCTDAPCTKSCPSGALNIDLISENQKININKSKMGLAVVHKESCLAFWGIQCDACYRVCPLIDQAITLKYELNEVTGKHARLLPEINGNICTGCGICEHACVVEKAAIYVLPEKMAKGEVGDHYIKSWEADDEKRIQQNIKVNDDETDIKSSLDYLNSEDELYD